MSRSYSVGFSAFLPVGVPLPGPVAQDGFTGTSGNDTFTGTSTGDAFLMQQGGDDIVKGKRGDDLFNYGDSLTAADRIDGGADSGNPFIGNRDTLFLDGDYSAGLVFGATTVVGVETIVLSGGHNYDLTIDDATVAAADFLDVNANLFGFGEQLAFDASAETDGTLRFHGGVEEDTVIGGAMGDSFIFGNTGFWAVDRIDGGSGGFDELILSGDYSAGTLFGPDTIRNIDVVYMYDGNDYSLATDDANVAAGETLTVSGAFLEIGDILTFDGSRERDGHLNLYGGDDNDTLTGGRRSDTIQGNDGADTLRGGQGADTYGYAGTGKSSGPAYDTVIGFDFKAADFFDVWFDVTGIDTAVRKGSLSAATFDADMANAIGDDELHADHAVLFRARQGDLVDKVFLIIDANGHAGYDAGIDIVVLLQNAAHLGDIDGADFI